jgi:hypothetical protein
MRHSRPLLSRWSEVMRKSRNMTLLIIAARKGLGQRRYSGNREAVKERLAGLAPLGSVAAMKWQCTTREASSEPLLLDIELRSADRVRRHT